MYILLRLWSRRLERRGCRSSAVDPRTSLTSSSQRWMVVIIVISDVNANCDSNCNGNGKSGPQDQLNIIKSKMDSNCKTPAFFALFNAALYFIALEGNCKASAWLNCTLCIVALISPHCAATHRITSVFSYIIHFARAAHCEVRHTWCWGSQHRCHAKGVRHSHFHIYPLKLILETIFPLQFTLYRCADSHVTILPEFVMPAGREAEFQAGFPKFYNATKVHSIDTSQIMATCFFLAFCCRSIAFRIIFFFYIKVPD